MSIVRYSLIFGLLASILYSSDLNASTFDQTPKREMGEHTRIGVLANRGTEMCLQEWQPTAAYLSARLAPLTFEIVPLGFEEVIDAVRESRVCYIAANPSYYAYMEHHGLARRIVTLQVPGDPDPQSYFGGVIFTRADRTDIQSMQDLRGRTFAAADARSLGGWHAAGREFHDHGISPTDFQSLVFAGTHDQVAHMVMAGQADAGTVRSTQLERMAREGRLDLKDIRVLNATEDTYPLYPYLLSTRLYPEWPLAALPCSPNELNKQIAVALLELDEYADAAQAMQGAGWTIPQDYTSVHDLLKTLSLPPYEYYGQVTLQEAIQQHWIPAIIIAVLLLCLIIVLGLVVRTNQKLRDAQQMLTQTHQDLKLAHQDITSAAAEAQHANRAKTEFISAVTDDIQPLLTTIIKHADALRSELPAGQSRQCLNRISSAAQSIYPLLSEGHALSAPEPTTAGPEDAPTTALDASIIRPALGKAMMDEINAAQQTLDAETIHSLATRIESAGAELSSDELAELGKQLAEAVQASNTEQIRSLLRFLTES